MQQPENTINMGGAPISPSALEMALKIAETHGEVHIVGVSTFHRNSLMEMAAFLMGMYEKVRHAKG